MSEINYCPQCGEKINCNIKFCPSCGHKIFNGPTVTHNANNSKREKVLNERKRKSGKKGLYAVMAIVAATILIFYLNTNTSKEEAVIEDQPVVSGSVSYPNVRVDHAYSIASAKDGKIIIPLDIVKAKKFVKFDYIGQKATIPLLVYLTEDGKIVTAISLCEPCDSKSFHIKGSDLICNSCGTTWDLNNLEAISGSCGKYPPDPIPSKVVRNEIQIDEYLVTGWARRV